MDDLKNYKIVNLLNILGLLGISLVLVMAFYYQLAHHELPCPLCLLQRSGFILIGIGFFCNVYYQIKNIHYSMVFIGCIMTITIAVRQILLHIIPGDPGYGSTLLGFHFYTHTVIISSAIMVFSAILIAFKQPSVPAYRSQSLLSKGVVSLFLLLIVANLLSTVLQCGTGQCADDPLYYDLLASLKNMFN